MTPSAFVPLMVLSLSLAACGSSDESTVNAGAGAGKGVDGQPVLNLGGGSGGGIGDGTGQTGNGECSPNLTGLVRDFKGANEPKGHPDFEAFSGNDASEGIVEARLGKDLKPVYKPKGPLMSQYGQQTTSKERFDQWYRNTDGVNEAVQFTIPLTPKSDGISSYDNGAFFPIDGQGFGDTPGQAHNFSFTFELHTTFTYRGGEIFTFTGDDDLWVFVNGHLGIDLGGLHPERSQLIDLDTVAEEFGMVLGGSYPLDLFHAERHTTASHFRVDTSIVFTNCDPIIRPK
jgi:fibro-slime domain-containing protein